MTTLRMGSRGSSLALTQSRWVRTHLQAADVASGIEIEVIRTKGDERIDVPLPEIGGKGLFTRELDDAILDGRIDFAVHSLKDLPTRLEPGLAIVSIPLREDPRDVLVGPSGTPVTLETLPAGARVGTSSVRRRAFLQLFRSDLDVADVRGNIDTRLRKLDDGEYDALILASAGLSRLGLGERIGQWLDRPAWLPAPAQGALGIVARTDAEETISSLRAIDHIPSSASARAERALLSSLDGGCSAPIGAWAQPFRTSLRLWGCVASPEGDRLVRFAQTGQISEAESLGRSVARQLRDRGAELLLTGSDPLGEASVV